MLRKYLNVIGFFITFLFCLFSCKSNNSNENNLAEKAKIDSIILNNFFQKLINKNVEITSNHIINSKLIDSLNAYKNFENPELKKNINQFFVYKKPIVTISNGVIRLDFSNDDFYSIFITKDKLIYSYQLAVGNNSGSYIADVSKKIDTNFFFVDSMSNKEIFFLDRKLFSDSSAPGYYIKKGIADYNLKIISTTNYTPEY